MRSKLFAKSVAWLRKYVPLVAIVSLAAPFAPAAGPSGGTVAVADALSTIDFDYRIDAGNFGPWMFDNDLTPYVHDFGPPDKGIYAYRNLVWNGGSGQPSYGTATAENTTVLPGFNNVTNVTMETDGFALAIIQKKNWGQPGLSGDHREYTGGIGKIKVNGVTKLKVKDLRISIEVDWPAQVGPGDAINGVGWGTIDPDPLKTDPAWKQEFDNGNGQLEFEFTSLSAVVQGTWGVFTSHVIVKGAPHQENVEVHPVIVPGVLQFPLANLALNVASFTNGGPPAQADQNNFYANRIMKDPGGAPPPGIAQVIPHSYWTLGTVLDAINTSVTFDITDIPNLPAATSLRILKREAAGKPWAIYSDYTLVDATHIKANNVNSFSDFGLGVINPVHNTNTGENFSTIQAAIDDADTQNGHVIKLDAGTYTENVNVNKQVTIESTSGSATDTIVVAADPNDHVFEVTASNFTINKLTIKGASGQDKAGINLNGVQNGNISGNTIRDNFNGIAIISNSYTTINQNIITSNGYLGIFMNSSSNNSISYNTITSKGITSYFSNENTYTHNTINSNVGAGITLINSNNNIIKLNSMTGNFYGVHIQGSHYNNLSLNNLTGNTFNDVYLLDTAGDASTDNVLYLNNINSVNNLDNSSNTWRSPQQLWYSYLGNNYNGYLGNRYGNYGGQDDGSGGRVAGDGVGDTAIPVTTDGDGDSYPLMLTYENYTLLTTRTLTMAVSPAGGGTTNPAAGAHTYPENTVVDISASAAGGYQFKNWTGLVANVNNPSTTVAMNADKTVTASFELIPAKIHNITTGENFSTIQAAIDDAATLNGHVIKLDAGTYTEHVNVNKSVTIQSTSGNPADTIVQAADPNTSVFHVIANSVTINTLTIKGASGYEQPGIHVTPGVQQGTISGNIIRDNYYGIKLQQAGHITVTENTASWNAFEGIYLYFANDNAITYNTVNNNSYYGIGVFFSSQNTVHGNLLNSNTWRGISINKSPNNTISLNSASSGEYGIYLEESNNSTLYMNNLTGNNTGIQISKGLSNSNGNILYLNNAVSNTYTSVWSDSTGNTWRSPQPLWYSYQGNNYYGYLGNRYDGYGGQDNGSGGRAAGDGVGDTALPYTTDTDGDSYPLMLTNENYVLLTTKILTLAVNPVGGGTTNPAAGAHTYPANTVVDIGATAAAGYQFKNWTGPVANVNTASTTVTLDADKTVTANFELIPKKIHNITSGKDFDTIQAAIDDAATLNGHVIKLDAGTYTENVNVNKQLTIESTSNNPGDTIVVAADPNDHVFEVSADNVTIKNLTVYGATGQDRAGIFFGMSTDHGTIANNRVGYDADHKNYIGIYLSSANDHTISGNTASFNTKDGIYLMFVGAKNNSIAGNTFNSNGQYGIHVYSGKDNLISGNTAVSNTLAGIFLEAIADSNTVSGNTFSSSEKGVHLDGSSFNNVNANAVSTNTVGVYLAGSNWNSIGSNPIDHNNIGIQTVSSSSNNTIIGNVITASTGSGIYLMSSGNTLYLNHLNNPGPGMNVFPGAATSNTNTWNSRTDLHYSFGGSKFRNRLGNYYHNYAGADAQGDGIGDSPYETTQRPETDDFPLMQVPENYTTRVWYLSNPKMYKNDLSKQPKGLALPAGGSLVWSAEPLEAVTYPANTSFAVQVTFTSAPSAQDTFTFEVGFSSDGSAFQQASASTTVAGDGTTRVFTVPITGELAGGPLNLALRVTNNSNTSYTVQTGGAWSYLTAPAMPDTGTVTGVVFDDLDGDATRDAGENGIQGVTVQLTGMGSQTTAADGTYSFTNVPAGSKNVSVTVPEGYIFITSPLFVVDVVAGTTSTGNFAFALYGAITGTVFNDLDGNGVKAPGEQALMNATIGVKKPITGQLVKTVYTNTSGVYSTGAVLKPGTYDLHVTKTGYVFDIKTANVTSGGTSTVNIGTGHTGTGTVSGVVFNDLNGNQAKDAGEAGLAGVTVELKQGDTVIDTQTTAADGTYSFTNVVPAAYTVVETDPAGYISTTPNTAMVDISQDTKTVNFGDVQPGSITGIKFYDLDGDGVKDPGEPGIANAIVVVNRGPSYDNPIETLTSADGTFSFNNLLPGLWVVVEEERYGFTNTTPNPVFVNVGAGETATVNFGDVKKGDANGDGNVDATDITLIERCIVGFDQQKPGADANGDGNLNALDITKSERIIAGLEPELQLSSSAFANGQDIPVKYTYDGQNLSPPLTWSGKPPSTQSFALLVDDPDAPGGVFNHWVLFNLPPGTSQLAEGIPADEVLANGAKQGRNDFGLIGYGGPSPPPGPEHRYWFVLYALDSTLNLNPGATRLEVLNAMQDHILSYALLTGLYQRQ